MKVAGEVDYPRVHLSGDRVALASPRVLDLWVVGCGASRRLKGGEEKDGGQEIRSMA
jgi:hypothetical protein